MVLTNSTMLALGTQAPGFNLPDVVSGKTVSLEEAAQGGKGLLVMFICRHCPYVVHVKPEPTSSAQPTAGITRSPTGIWWLGWSCRTSPGRLRPHWRSTSLPIPPPT